VLFSDVERIEILKEVTADIPNVEVESFSGLLIDYAKKKDIKVVIRGLRAITDFEYELQMALMNRSLRDDCETIFMMPTTNNSFVSSRLVKEVANLGADYSKYVPPPVAARIAAKLKEQQK